MQNRRSYFAYVLLGVFVLGGLAYVLYPYLNREASSVATSPATAPTFIKEGEVTFLENGRKVSKIDVEIAENEAERSRGLMYRPYMPDSVGMLFIFQEAKPQAFWMRNTHIPLDIIYVGPDKKIVSIQKNARPYSDESLTSYGDVQYVVEVNAGYADRYGIGAGDSISF